MTDVKEDILRYVAYRFTRDPDKFVESIKKHRKFVDSIPKIMKMQKESKLWQKYQRSLKK